MLSESVLTIWECPKHGPRKVVQPRSLVCDFHGGSDCRESLVPVRVYREEDVRPLWEAASGGVAARGMPSVQAAVDVFPAPEEWSR